MNRKISITELSSALAKRTGTDKQTAAVLLRNYFATIANGLEKDSLVKVKGFATFKTLTVEERESININTGERISIGSHTKISFAPDMALKALVNRPFSHFKTITLNDETSIEELEEMDRRLQEEQESVAGQQPEETAVPEEVTAEEEIPEPIEKAAATKEETPVPEEEIVTKEGLTEAETEDTIPVEELSALEEEAPEAGEQTEENGNENRRKVIEFVDSDNEEQTNDGCSENSTDEMEEDEDTEPQKKHTALKWFGGTLLAIALFAAGYFVGNILPYTSICSKSAEPAAKAVSAQPAQQPISKAEAKPAAQAPADTASVAAPAPVKPEIPVKGEANPEAPRPAALPKHPTGTVTIVGTQSIHTLKAGEDLTHLSLQYYGSKDYALYIIKHNELENPNVIHVGSTIKMPRLKVE